MRNITDLEYGLERIRDEISNCEYNIDCYHYELTDMMGDFDTETHPNIIGLREKIAVFNVDLERMEKELEELGF